MYLSGYYESADLEETPNPNTPPREVEKQFNLSFLRLGWSSLQTGFGVNTLRECCSTLPAKVGSMISSAEY